MMTLPLGTMRRLQQCSTPRNGLAVMALDHRGNLRQLLRPDAPTTVPAQELVDFKRSLVRSLAPAASAVLLDPEFSAAQVIAQEDLPGQVGLVVALEATGYTGDAAARVSRVLPGWSVEKALRMGASAIKLLVYYHPDSPMATQMEELVQQVAQDCQRNEMLFFLETLSYSLDPNVKKLAPDERKYVVLETARRLTPLGGDVLKAEFPLDAAAVSDENAWRQACSELSQASRVPWVLLSASVDYDTFLKQVCAACLGGASGVAVGRAVWREATDFSGNARQAFLDGVGRQRMQRVTELVDALAKPWSDFYQAPEITPEWFR